MKDEEIKARVKSCLTFMMMGGLRASLFTDTPEEDFTAMVEAEVIDIPLSLVADTLLLPYDIYLYATRPVWAKVTVQVVGADGEPKEGMWIMVRNG